MANHSSTLPPSGGRPLGDSGGMDPRVGDDRAPLEDVFDVEEGGILDDEDGDVNAVGNGNGTPVEEVKAGEVVSVVELIGPWDGETPDKAAAGNIIGVDDNDVAGDNIDEVGGVVSINVKGGTFGDNVDICGDVPTLTAVNRGDDWGVITNGDVVDAGAEVDVSNADDTDDDAEPTERAGLDFSSITILVVRDGCCPVTTSGVG
jgi:hypothetical protein